MTVVWGLSVCGGSLKCNLAIVLYTLVPIQYVEHFHHILWKMLGLSACFAYCLTVHPAATDG
ncbi:hypothetical protein K466DRAFT_591672 [Polyporus arcularius HHB13444]|uniref:Uncharacterized protein n=1 Tax=Polyporus arcularius HHB13444 TaxID=1314778 RepID=A0A5C3NW58_9APHY|nr:hypothetical protein K466DRAFT_591672 [Polyporus arcularius HHB13444]